MVELGNVLLKYLDSPSERKLPDTRRRTKGNRKERLKVPIKGVMATSYTSDREGVRSDNSFC